MTIGKIKNEFKSKDLPFVTFDAASDIDIDTTSQALLDSEFSKLPASHTDFLKNTNGFYFNGVYFFGTKKHIREKANYTIPDLVDITQRCARYGFFKNKIIIGHAPEGFIYYCNKEERYFYANRTNLLTIVETQDLYELIKYLAL